MNKARAWIVPLCLLLAAPAFAESAESPRVIAVNGHGEVAARPDRARLNLAVDALDAELARAEARVNGVVRDYLAAVRKLGLKNEKIATTGITIHPEYAWDEKQRQQKLIGYRVRRDIGLTIDDLDKLGDYVLAATDAGINHVNAPVLESSRAEALSREALVAAVKDAREQAKLIADTLGVSLGAARNVSVQDSSPPPPVPMKVMAMRAEAADMSGNEAMGLTPGEIRYSADAAVQFDLIAR